MTAPLVVEYLQTHSFDDLMRDHQVEVSIGTSPYKASLNYHQFFAKNDNQLSCECRGLVIATLDGSPLPTTGLVGRVQVLARPMDRFFNHGQDTAHEIDLDHPETRVFEKADGTLCIAYHDTIEDRWCVATRSVPDADLPIGGFEKHTFGSLFRSTLREHLGTTLEDLALWKHITYCFELTTPFNRVVVNHKTSKVYAIAMRDRETGNEACPTEPRFWGLDKRVETVPSHGTRSLAELLELVASRPPTDHEGVVVRMSQADGKGPFRRVKVKSAAYLAASKLNDAVGSSPRNLMSVILLGQFDDVIPVLPEPIVEHGEKMRDGLRLLCEKFESKYVEIRSSLAPDDPNQRKSMALAVQREKLWLAPAMELFTGKAPSFREWIDGNKKDGAWGDTFLDSLMSQIEAVQ